MLVDLTNVWWLYRWHDANCLQSAIMWGQSSYDLVEKCMIATIWCLLRMANIQTCYAMCYFCAKDILCTSNRMTLITCSLSLLGFIPTTSNTNLIIPNRKGKWRIDWRVTYASIDLLILREDLSPSQLSVIQTEHIIMLMFDYCLLFIKIVI